MRDFGWSSGVCGLFKEIWAIDDGSGWLNLLLCRKDPDNKSGFGISEVMLWVRLPVDVVVMAVCERVEEMHLITLSLPTRSGSV